MGYTVKPKCLACGFEWPNVTIGNAKNFVCVCAQCNNIVNPERNGFRRELRPCPNCGGILTVADTIDMLNTPVDHAGELPSGVKCPQCKDGDISFRTIMHFSMRRCDRAPEQNEMVHAVMKNGKLDVPGMFLFDAVPQTVGIPEDCGTRLMELRTSNVVRNEENVHSIEFEFVRYADV